MRIVIEKNVPATMRDGVILHANVYRPDVSGPYPVLLTRTPYGKDMAATFVLDPVRMAEAGYIVVVQDVRGRFASQGDYGNNDQEFTDGFDTVQWAAQLPDTTGAVGMFGASYYGFTQWAAAVMHPPALKALAPLIAYADHWEGPVYRAGAFEWGLMGSWQLAMAAQDLARRQATDPQFPLLFAGIFHDLDRMGQEGYWELPIDTFAPLEKVGMHFLSEQVSHDTYDDYWRALSVRGRLKELTIPALHIGGWYDVFIDSTLRSFREMRDAGQEARLIIGPWTHLNQSGAVGALDFGSAASLGFLGLQDDVNALHRKWFDWQLKGSQAPDVQAFAQLPPVRIFTMGDNRWQFAQDWPLPQTTYTPVYLHSGGHANTASGNGFLSFAMDDGRQSAVPAIEDRGYAMNSDVDHFVYDPANPVLTTGGNLLMSAAFPTGPQDQAHVEERDDVLVYTSDVLTSDVEVTGPVKVKLWVSTNVPDTDFVARLCDVHPDGRSYNIADGIIRLRYRDSLSEPTLVKPGQVYAIDIDCWATSNVFKAGHRMRVVITSSSFPRWSRNLNTGESSERTQAAVAAQQSVYHDREHPSHILLPIIPK